jgi:hypothetical protein
MFEPDANIPANTAMQEMFFSHVFCFLSKFCMGINTTIE